MAETLAALRRLWIVREIQEDTSGAVLRFQEGGHGRLVRDAAHFASDISKAIVFANCFLASAPCLTAMKATALNESACVRHSHAQRNLLCGRHTKVWAAKS